MMGSFPQAGDAAPDFTLPSTSGDDVALSSFRGEKNVLLAFFPAAFSGVCTVEMCEFSSGLDDLISNGVQVLPISVDAIPSLGAFKKHESISLDLLSDSMREVSRLYGTLIESKNISNRAYVLINREGKVVWSHAEANPGEKRGLPELLSQMQALA